MGGQACVYYGAAEFSRDTDVALLADPENISRLREALDALNAVVIAVPPLDIRYLEKGHAVHFRCYHPDASGMRLDVMSVMRGLPCFDVLWERRSTVVMDGKTVELMSLPDLVTAKKTQRDKDWPMIRRLVEAHYVEFASHATPERVAFWLKECRTPVLLAEISASHPEAVDLVAQQRPFLTRLTAMSDEEVEQALAVEEAEERARDKAYWMPLRKELEKMRRGKI